RLKPDLPEAYIARGGSYHLMGQHEKGLADRTEAIRLNPRSADGWFARGSAYFLLGDLQKAVAGLRGAARLNPQNTEMHDVLTKAEARIEEMKKPQASTKPVDPAPATTLAPKEKLATIPVPANSPSPPEAKRPSKPAPARGDAEAHHQKGRELLQKGQYRAAIDELTQAIASKPDLALAWNARGYAYLLLRDPTNAIKDFDRAIELNPRYANAYRNRGSARNAAGDAEGAAADRERAKQLEK